MVQKDQMTSRTLQEFGYSVIPVSYRGVESPVVIGRSSLRDLGGAMRVVADTTVAALIADSRVAGLYGQQTLDTLHAEGLETRTLLLSIENKDKVLSTVERVYRFLTQIRADWGTTVVLLGGNVLIDSAGYAAVTFCRGLPYVVVPTTLLSQADGAIGGALGVHYRHLTNYVGARVQPALVWSDLDTLSTLPDAELQAGMAEVVKQAVVADEEMFLRLEYQDEFDLRDPDYLASIVLETVRLKSGLVERGEDGCLNFGHTIGHALESVLHHQLIRHGEGVAIGMYGEMLIAEQMGMVPPASAERLEALLGRIGLPVRIPRAIVDRFRSPLVLAQQIQRMTLRDKKMIAGVLRWVLPSGIGRYQRSEVDPTLVIDTLMRLMDSNAYPDVAATVGRLAEEAR